MTSKGENNSSLCNMLPLSFCDACTLSCFVRVVEVFDDSLISWYYGVVQLFLTRLGTERHRWSLDISRTIRGADLRRMKD